MNLQELKYEIIKQNRIRLFNGKNGMEDIENLKDSYEL